MPFPELPIPLRDALASRGYAEPTTVQSQVLEAPVSTDLLVSAQTGSGKTVAFGLVVARHLFAAPAAREPRPANAPLALVVAPTRELALQVARELTWLYEKADLRVVSCVGGMDVRREQRQLDRGCDVVVGTPGRLTDHVTRGNLDLSRCESVVLDEADEMLDLGFREELECVLDAARTERMTLMFSATLPKPIEQLATRYQRSALRIAASAVDEPHGDIDYRALKVAPRDREHALVNVLRWHERKGALVFCATRETVKHVHGKLLERGFAVVALSGEMAQSERTRAVQALRDGRAQACVATDVAARGLDLPDLGLVVHGDLPRDPQTLLHRSGRTGRAGRKGTAVLLVEPRERRRAESLIAGAGVVATWGLPPSPDAIRAADEERILREALEVVDANALEDRALAPRLLAERTPEQLAAGLSRLLRMRLPSPEDLAEVFDAPPPRARRPFAHQPGGGTAGPGGGPPRRGPARPRR